MTEKKGPVSPVFSQMAALTLPDLNAVAGLECGVAMLFPPVKNVVGSLTAQESQAAFLRGTSPEAEGRTGAG